MLSHHLLNNYKETLGCSPSTPLEKPCWIHPWTKKLPDEGPSLKMLKFSLYFSGSCIPINPKLSESFIVESSYLKPPTISPALIYFRKRFLMGLYKGGLIYGWAYTWTIFCVSNKQVRHKQVGHKHGKYTCINPGENLMNYS